MSYTDNANILLLSLISKPLKMVWFYAPFYKLYDGNVMFRNMEQVSKNRVKFTLRTKDSRGPGSRIGYTGRHMPCACWHVHGHFFEFLFKNYTGVKIWSQGQLMESNADNWKDRNIGSIIRPMYFSEACECRIYSIEKEC